VNNQKQLNPKNTKLKNKGKMTALTHR